MMIFAWEIWNLEHIAGHGVDQEEAESVVRAARPPFPLLQGGGKSRVQGPTPSGRWLQVIFVLRDTASIDLHWIAPEDRLDFADVQAVHYVIHARDLTERERRDTRKKLGRT